MQNRYYLTDDELVIIEKNGITKRRYSNRRTKGWTHERAMSQSLNVKIINGEITRKHNELREQADAKGIKYVTLKNRIKSGWSLERALNTPVKKIAKKLDETEKEILAKNGVSLRAYQARISYGWTREIAINTPRCNKRNPLFNEVQIEQIKKLNISMDVVWTRLKRLGWSMERAISTPTGKYKK